MIGSPQAGETAVVALENGHDYLYFGTGPSGSHNNPVKGTAYQDRTFAGFKLNKRRRKMKKLVMTLTAAMALTSGIAFAAADNATMVSPSNEAAPVIKDAMSVKTKDFVTKAALGGLFEIESSKIAQQKAQDLDVQKFAQMMIDDHTKVAEEMKAAMQRAGIDPNLAPTTLDSKSQEKLKELSNEKVKDFDEEYMDEQESAHADTIRLFKDYVSDGDVQELKEFASKTLPALEAHHTRAKELEDKVD